MVAVGAAIRVARINRGASSKGRHGLGGAAVVLQGPEVGVGIVQVTRGIEAAAVVATEVVPLRGHRALTVASSIARDNAVLEYRLGAIYLAEDAASRALACDNGCHRRRRMLDCR